MRGIVSFLVLVGFASTLLAQSSELPSAPTPPKTTAAPALKLEAPSSKSLFTLPTDEPLPSANPAPKKPEFCFAKLNNTYANKARDISPKTKGPMRVYLDSLHSQIFSDWAQHMTLAEKNAWGRGRKVAVRFVLHPDGTYDTPELTVSSGRERYDQHAMEAIRSHDSFPPFPNGVTYPVNICMIVGFHLDPDNGDRTGWIDDLNKKL